MKRYALIHTLLLIILLAAVTVHPGQAQTPTGTIVVNTGDDEVNNDPDCSLREAIIAANENRRVSGCAAGRSGAPDAIFIDPRVTDLEIRLSDPNLPDAYWGDLDITESLSIFGNPGTTISVKEPTLNERVFHINVGQGGSVTLRSLRISNGKPGVGLSVGGGVYNQSGALNVEECEIIDNQVLQAGGGIYNGPGATLRVTNTRFIRNVAARGGGILNQGSARITNSYFTQNVGSVEGGGLNHNAISDKVVLINNTFYQNISDSGAEVFLVAPLEMTNNTIVSNSLQALYLAGSGFMLDNIILQRLGSGLTCKYDPVSTVTSAGYNLENQDNCRLTADGDLVLQTGTVVEDIPDEAMSRGGKTPYLWLPAGSPAIDSGKNCASNDQRGTFWLRLGEKCDIGSIEVETLVETVPNKLFLPGIFNQ